MLGLDPDPAALWPRRVQRVGGAGAATRLARARTAEAVIGALPRRDRRRRARLRGRQAPARLLRAPRRSRLGGARAGRRDRARPRPARARRRQARRRPGHRARLRAGARGRDARPVRARRRASARTPSPPTRCSGRDALEPLVEAAAEAGAGLLRARRPRTRARPTSRTRATRRCTSGSRGWSTSSAREHVGDCGLSLRRRRHRRHPARSCLARLRELMPRAIFLLPGVGAQGGTRRGPRPGVRAAPRGRPRHGLALDRERARASAAASPPPPPRRRPRSCAPPPGSSSAARGAAASRRSARSPARAVLHARCAPRGRDARARRRTPRSPARASRAGRGRGVGRSCS